MLKCVFHLSEMILLLTRLETAFLLHLSYSMEAHLYSHFKMENSRGSAWCRSVPHLFWSLQWPLTFTTSLFNTAQLLLGKENCGNTIQCGTCLLGFILGLIILSCNPDAASDIQELSGGLVEACGGSWITRRTQWENPSFWALRLSTHCSPALLFSSDTRASP